MKAEPGSRVGPFSVSSPSTWSRPQVVPGMAAQEGTSGPRAVCASIPLLEHVT